MTTFIESQRALITKKAQPSSPTLQAPPLQQAFHKYRCGQSECKQDKDLDFPAWAANAWAANPTLHRIKWTSPHIQSCEAQP